MNTRRKFIRNTGTALGAIGLMQGFPLKGIASMMPAGDGKITYVPRFVNENHPELAYWFIAPDLYPEKAYLPYIDQVAADCPYTLIFLTARDGADFFDYKQMHPIFKDIVTEGHLKGLKIGLQLWGNGVNVRLEDAVRMITDTEVTLDPDGRADLQVKARFIRFPDRLLRCDLLRVFAFKKTGDGFYDPSTKKDITHLCTSTLPDKSTVDVKIRGGKALKGFTAYVMTQQYCAKSDFYGEDEFNRFGRAIDAYGDIPFDGFALDEYGNKFVSRVEHELVAGEPFRGRWYALNMAKKFQEATGGDLIDALFDGRYAPEGKPEVRMKAINLYMDFMRSGALIIENAVYRKSREVFGAHIFNGIHDTYHNSLINDEIWANGISWWKLPRQYGQTDEKTKYPIQMGIAMSHPMNAMYNQYYDVVIPNVYTKALKDLTFGIRTHYHALHDKRPNRSDLDSPEAIEGIGRVENCARLLNKFNPLLPRIQLLVVFGIEALSNWYPRVEDRGVYDINDKMQIDEKAMSIWEAGYLNAVMPSDLIAENKLTLNEAGKPTINGHTFDALIYLYPQHARESQIRFLETYLDRGGKLMIEGPATHDFDAKDVTERFGAIYRKAAVQGFSIQQLPKLGLMKNSLPNGCVTEDDSYVFTDLESLLGGKAGAFQLSIDGTIYTGEYRGIVVVAFDQKAMIKKLSATGLTEIKRNGETVLSFSRPTDVHFDPKDPSSVMTIADGQEQITPLVNKLFS